MPAERVTVTLPPDLLQDLDRRATNRSHKRRVRRRFGRLPSDQRCRIDEGLRLYLGL